MMTKNNQVQKAVDFKALHSKEDPLFLYNVWDAHSAETVANNRAQAIATSSWAIAKSHSFEDGENIPMDLALTIISRIVQSVFIPVSCDFEGGYARSPDTLKDNIATLLETGVVGINFEDRVIGGKGLYSSEDQAARIQAIRGIAKEKNIPLFINARTDIFLQNEDHAQYIKQALDRAKVYKDAGADCFFVPGLIDGSLIKQICDKCVLPVNVMIDAKQDYPKSLAQSGVSRISTGHTSLLQSTTRFASDYTSFKATI